MKIGKPFLPVTITNGNAKVTLHSSNFSYSVESLSIGGGRPISRSTHSRQLLAQVAIPSLVQPAGPSGPFEQALSLAGLEEQDGGFSLSNVTPEPGAGTAGKLDFSVDGDSRPVLAVKYVGEHVQVYKPDADARFSIDIRTVHPATDPLRHNLAFALDLSPSIHAVIRIFKYVGEDIWDDIEQTISAAVAHYIERSIKPKEQLLKFSSPTDGGSLQPVDEVFLKHFTEKSNLLFVHGLFSSIYGAFGDLLSNSQFDAVHKKYGGRVIGWDHWTVSKAPSDNAIALANALPKNSSFNIVCHSRGGLVVRYLLEDRTTQKILRKNGIRINKVVFVAGAYGGDPLASPNNSLLTFLNAFITLGQRVPNPVVQDIAVALRVVTALAHGVQTLPGIEELDPAKVMKHSWRSPAKTQYFVAWANYDLQGEIWDGCIDSAMREVLGDASDFVIPYNCARLPNVSATATQLKIINALATSQSEVHHLNYFGSQASPVPQFLIDVL